MTPLISPAALASAAEQGWCFHRRTCLPELPTREENACLPPDPLCSSPTAFFLQGFITREGRLPPCTPSLAALGGVCEFTQEAT